MKHNKFFFGIYITTAIMGLAFFQKTTNNSGITLVAKDNVVSVIGEKEDSDKITEISIGGSHAIATSQDGEVFAWGNNLRGQLGNNDGGEGRQRGLPINITSYLEEAGLDSENDQIITIESGGFHSGALSQKGEVFTWGHNDLGQLGDNKASGEQKDVPINITDKFNFDLVESQIISLQFNRAFSMALSNKGEVFTWGSNSSGQLGDNQTSGSQSNVPINITSYLVDAGLDNENDKIIAINSGAYHSSALSQNGEVFIWGSNTNGQLGNNSGGEGQQSNVPINITQHLVNAGLDSEDKIISVELGWRHSSVLSQEGKVFTWGNNEWGQLGDETIDNKHTPTNVTNKFNLDDNDKITKITLGWQHSSAQSQNGKFFTWGSNSHGQLGNNDGGEDKLSNVPINITQYLVDAGFDSVNDEVIVASLGGVVERSGSSIVSQNGEVFTWGDNFYGQLGDNHVSGENSFIPLHISKITTNGVNSQNLVYLSSTEDEISYKYEFDVTIGIENNGDNVIPLLDENNNPTDYAISVDGMLLQNNEEVNFIAQLTNDKPQEPETWEFNYLASKNSFLHTSYETVSFDVYNESNISFSLTAKVNVANEKTLKFNYSTASLPFEAVNNIHYEIEYEDGQTQSVTHDKGMIKSDLTEKEINLEQAAYEIKDVSITINYEQILAIDPVVVPANEFVSNYDDLISEIKDLTKTDVNLGLIIGLSVGLAVVVIGSVTLIHQKKWLKTK